MLDERDVAAGTRQTLVPDVQGSIIASLDSGTGTLTKIGYQAYGEHPGLTSGSYRYTAQRFDPETAGSSAEPSGLYDYRARIYSPTLGRFLQPDPAGYVAGTNLYAYVNNDPLDNTDPSGQVKDAVTQGLSYAYNNPLQVAGIGLAIGATIVAPLNSAALPEEIAGIEATAEVSEAVIAAEEAGDLVTVTHFTSAEGAAAIGEGGTLNTGSFVTTSNLSDLSAAEVESTLEIDAGKGAFSTTFQTPASNLGPAFNGPFTSGGAPQFQLINPTPVTTFVPTIVGP